MLNTSLNQKSGAAARGRVLCAHVSAQGCACARLSALLSHSAELILQRTLLRGRRAAPAAVAPRDRVMGAIPRAIELVLRRLRGRGRTPTLLLDALLVLAVHVVGQDGERLLAHLGWSIGS